MAKQTKQTQASQELVYLDVNDIEMVQGRNVRFEMGDLNALADMIEAQGLRNPVKIQFVDGKPQLTEGHRRVLAGHILKERYAGKETPIKRNRPVTTYPCFVIDSDEKSDSIIVDLILSNEGKPFVPLEEGEAYRRLRDDHNMTLEQIAARVGKSVSHISRRIALYNSAPELKQHVEDGTLRASTATDIAVKTGNDHTQQKKVAEFVNQQKQSGKTSAEIDKRLADNIQRAKQKQQEQQAPKPEVKSEAPKQKVGRLVQWQRTIADELAQELFAAETHPDCTFAKNELWREGRVVDFINSLQHNPDNDFLLALGAMVALCTLDGVELHDFMNKMHKEQTGTEGHYKDSVKEEKTDVNEEL